MWPIVKKKEWNRLSKKREHDGIRDKEAKYRESCQDVRGFNTTIRLYWSDAFQSVYLSEPANAFLNLLIPLLLSQSFHQFNNPSWTSALILSESRTAHVCFKLLIMWFRGAVKVFFKTVIFYSCNISDVCLDCSWQSTTSHGRLSYAHVGHKINALAAQALEMSGCRLLRENQCQSHELLNSSGHMALFMKGSRAIIQLSYSYTWLSLMYTNVTKMPLVTQKNVFREINKIFIILTSQNTCSTS